ncbi:hypothetical protein [Cohnella abietis]|uniref:Uncharacterized protein n=1 Tax=Cohnella abietis TaxID=2507935 RepID=A0A3T1D2Z2_9BACL|nr:hypothetical protein [Cohnella abietis]BBI32454.1 hypothetical protein KCTCHS21_18530 [Cohnella abietis]
MFQGVNHTQRATSHIASAIELLREAKYNLLKSKSVQHVHLAMNLGSLEEIYGNLMDPEITPEIMEGVEIIGFETDLVVSKVIPIND